MSPLLNTFAESSLYEPGPGPFEQQVKGITERVSAVYPRISREDIHEIVWMSLPEMTHKQGQESVKEDDSFRKKYGKSLRICRGDRPVAQAR